MLSKRKLLILPMIMAFLLMLVCLPANTIHAASKIEITKTSQTMKVVKLYWK